MDRDITQRELVDIAAGIVRLGRQNQAQASAVRVEKAVRRKVVYRDGQWEEMAGSTTLQVVVRLFVDGRYAVHRTSDVRPEELPAFVAGAVALTRQVMPDEHRKLPAPALYAPAELPDTDTCDPAMEALTLEERKRRAVAAHDACSSQLADRRISVSASFSDTRAWGCLVHSDGFSADYRETACALTVTAAVTDPSGRRPSDWHHSAACHLRDLAAPEEVGQKAAKRALAAVGARPAPTGTYEILVENRAVGSLLNGLLQPLFGSEIFNRRSWAAEKEGMPVGASCLFLADDPLVPRALGSRRYDSEGLAARRLPLLEAGVLRNFYVDTYYGSRLGRRPTTGSPSNLVLVPGERDFQSLLASMRRGLWIDRFIGGNVNGTTGDFSMGVGGFLVEDGRVVAPVIEMNLAGNHRTFWQQVQALGSDVWTASSVRVPSLLLSPLLVAGRDGAPFSG